MASEGQEGPFRGAAYLTFLLGVNPWFSVPSGGQGELAAAVASATDGYYVILVLIALIVVSTTNTCASLFTKLSARRALLYHFCDSEMLTLY